MNMSSEIIYKIVSENRIMLNERLIHNEETVQRWRLQLKQPYGGGLSMVVEVTESPQVRERASMPLLELLNLINKPTNVLHLSFNSKYKLTNVDNMHEIFTCWEQTKKEITEKTGNGREVIDMIKEKEESLFFLREELSDSLRHFILFSSMSYGRKHSLKTPSVLAEGSKVEVDTCESDVVACNGQKTYSQEGDGYLSDLSRLKKKYNEQIKLYADNAGFNYKYTFHTDYTVDADTGTMEKSVTDIMEQASEKYVYFQTITFDKEKQ
jgi:hypothetical protein